MRNAGVETVNHWIEVCKYALFHSDLHFKAFKIQICNYSLQQTFSGCFHHV